MNDTVRCPNCQTKLPLPHQSTTVVCGECDWQFETLQHLCPACGTYHHKPTAVCLECGTPLNRICQRCKSLNWSGDSVCNYCGRSLELFETVGRYHGKGTADRLNEQMRHAKAIKELERQDSEVRMARFLEEEEGRRRLLAERIDQQRARDRRILLITAMAVIAFFIVLVVYSMSTSGG